ncbi:MAG: hypothetical protein V1816_21805 [Pseudomonadota bacterium]
MLIMSHGLHKLLDQEVGIVPFLHRFFLTIAHGFRDSRFLLHVRGKLRRQVMVHFRKRHVRNQLLARGGGCRQCGVCCNLLITCPMLTKQGRCLVYGSCRPQSCKVFPIDQRDIDEVGVCGGRCGYTFDQGGSAPVSKRGRSSAD